MTPMSALHASNRQPRLPLLCRSHAEPDRFERFASGIVVPEQRDPVHGRRAPSVAAERTERRRRGLPCDGRGAWKLGHVMRVLEVQTVIGEEPQPTLVGVELTGRVGR